MSRVGKNAAAAMATMACAAFIFSTLVPLSGAQADTTPPVTNASVTGTPGSNGWYISNASVNLTATDDVSGVNRTLYSLDGAQYAAYSANITLSDGYHTLLYYSVDNSSKAEALKQLIVKVDTHSPVASILIKGNQSPTGWYNESVQVNLTASDATSGVWWTSYSLDGSPLTLYAGNITIGDGEHVLTYESYDWAGNAYHNSATIRVSDPTINVILSGNQLGNGWFTTDVLVSFVASGGAGGIDHVEYGFDGRNWTTGSHFTITAEGANRTFYRAVDNAGNVGSVKALWVGVDKTGPTIGIEISGDKASQGWYNGDITVTLRARDNGSINRTEYSLDGYKWVTYKDPFKVSWGDSRNIYYRTTDMAGNTSSGSTFIYFRPQSFYQGAMSDSVWINGILYGPSTPQGTSTVTPTPVPSATPTPNPAPTPTPTPLPTAEAPGSSGPLTMSILVAVLVLVAIGCAAAYLIVFKPK